MAVNKRLVTVALAKQTGGRGVFPTAAEYITGVDGGTVVEAGLKDDDLASTWSTRILEGRDRTGAIPAAAYGLYAMPKSIGDYLNAVCGGHTTTGAGPYVHTFTPQTTLPYFTLWPIYGTDQYRIRDAKLDELDLAFPNSGACKLSTKWMGTGLDFAATAPTGGVNERPGVDGVLRSAGGTFQLDGTAVRVVSGTLKVANAIGVLPDATTVTPGDLIEGLVSLALSLVLAPDDMSQYRKITTGSATGTTIANTPLVGSCDLLWKGPTTSQLELTVPSLTYDPTNLPAADPKGGPAEITIPAVATGAATAGFTFALTNGIATYT